MTQHASLDHTSSAHFPVMLPEVISALKPQDGKIYVDGTFGAGGYTRAILKAADCTVIAIDRDPGAKQRAEDLKAEFGDRFIFVPGQFGDVIRIIQEAGFKDVDGFVLDIGVSSMQIDDPSRGFSFRFEGPLDMRMGNTGESAQDIVNTYREEDLANIIYQYGEERQSRRIARRIVEARAKSPLTTTSALADVVRAAIPRAPQDKIDPATRTFQALRIAVNDELGELTRALQSSEIILVPSGRLVVVSFHSLEDGIVKSFLYERSGKVPASSRHVPSAHISTLPSFTLPFRKPIEASALEIDRNPRSRSAKLRAAIRTEHPAHHTGGRA
ncbi:MAG: 16S rRNA (cytosine(1402)-N(4))-methyltransferase RsmH [Alphaproteobacteria bacterium]|nr:16S rRNA (cytosine(1402)-N(4))-methyltransferase RsmH [Alphaproteobacteria bacterium]